MNEHGGPLRVSLRLPDGSTISLDNDERTSNSLLTYATRRLPLDLSRPVKAQLQGTLAREFIGDLPTGGYALVQTIDRLRESFCRQASLCGGSLDVLLDLFRDPAQIDANPMEASDERGWKLKKHNESRVVETVLPPGR